MSLDVTYRAYREADLDSVAKVWFDAWQSTGLDLAALVTVEDNRVRLARELRSGWVVHVACEGARVVGFLAFNPAKPYLHQLFVAPDVQGKGVGAALLRLAMTHMPDGFQLRTAAANVRACGFYDRNGLIRERVEAHPEEGHQVVIYAWSGGAKR